MILVMFDFNELDLPVKFLCNTFNGKKNIDEILAKLEKLELLVNLFDNR